MDTNQGLEPGAGGQVAPSTAAISKTLASAAPAAPPPSPMGAAIASAQTRARAGYEKMKGAVAMLAKVREQMDKLTALADTVTQDDVVEAAGKLVGAGLGSVAVAGILASMPEDGEALQGWVRQQDQQIVQREAQAVRALQLTRHQLGVTAMKSIIGHSAEQHAAQLPLVAQAKARLAARQALQVQAQQQPQGAPPANPLTLGTPANG